MPDLLKRVADLERRVAALEAPPDDGRCVLCGERLPPLGQEGHTVRFEGGVELHYCDEH